MVQVVGSVEHLVDPVEIHAPVIYTLTRAVTHDRQDETPVRFGAVTEIEITDPVTRQLHVVTGQELIEAIRQVSQRVSPAKQQQPIRRKTAEGTMSRTLHLLKRTSERGRWPNGAPADLGAVAAQLHQLVHGAAQTFEALKVSRPELHAWVSGFLRTTTGLQ